MRYKIIMSFKESQVISEEKYKKLSDVLLNQNVPFVSINGVLVQTKDIRMIKPIKPRTRYGNSESEAKILEAIKNRKQLKSI